MAVMLSVSLGLVCNAVRETRTPGGYKFDLMGAHALLDFRC